MRLTPSCVAVFLSLCFDSFEYRPNACKTSSVVIGVVRIFAKCQRIVYFFANIPAEPGSSLQQRGFLCDLRRREARYQKSDALTESSLPHMECCGMRVGYGTITRIFPHPKDGYEKMKDFFVYPLNCATVSITFAKVIPPDPLPEEVGESFEFSWTVPNQDGHYQSKPFTLGLVLR